MPKTTYTFSTPEQVGEYQDFNSLTDAILGAWDHTRLWDEEVTVLRVEGGDDLAFTPIGIISPVEVSA